jgi:hypothetical protein
MWEDGCVMPRNLTHGAEASSSRASLPAPNGTVSHLERERKRASAPPAHFNEAQAEQVLWQEFRDHGASLNNALNEALRIHEGPAGGFSRYTFFLLDFWSLSPLVSPAFSLLLTQFLSCLVCWWQELECRAREKYSSLDRLNSERNLYRDQYDALDALVKALRTDNGWLEYRLQAVRDELLEKDAQAAEDASAVEKVGTVLLERDEALQKAREDAAAMRTVAAEWETEVASIRAQLEQDCATLEGARSWQSQAEERAKEAEQLRTSLADKAASLTSTEEQLQRERDTRH